METNSSVNIAGDFNLLKLIKDNKITVKQIKNHNTPEKPSTITLLI